VTLNFGFDFGLDHPVPQWYIYGDLALQVGGVSDETANCGNGFYATRTIEWLHCKLQTHPLIKEGTPQKQDRKFQTATYRQEVISGRKSQRVLDTKTYWLTISRTVTSNFEWVVEWLRLALFKGPRRADALLSSPEDPVSEALRFVVI
jgi:hypothetical protein